MSDTAEAVVADLAKYGMWFEWGHRQVCADCNCYSGHDHAEDCIVARAQRLAAKPAPALAGEREGI